jgi:hypothetical protein
MLFIMDPKLVSRRNNRKAGEGVREWGAQEIICPQDRRSNCRVNRTVGWASLFENFPSIKRLAELII